MEQPDKLNEQVVEGRVGHQAGYEILHFRCPRCRMTAAISREGKILCNCGTMIRVKKPEVSGG